MCSVSADKRGTRTRLLEEGPSLGLSPPRTDGIRSRVPSVPHHAQPVQNRPQRIRASHQDRKGNRTGRMRKGSLVGPAVPGGFWSRAPPPDGDPFLFTLPPSPPLTIHGFASSGNQEKPEQGGWREERATTTAHQRHQTHPALLTRPPPRTFPKAKGWAAARCARPV